MTKAISVRGFKLKNEGGGVNLGKAYLYILSLEVRHDERIITSDSDERLDGEVGEELDE